MEQAALRSTLLDLIGSARRAELDRLGEADWAELDRLAAMHRLQPLLHHRASARTEIPPDIAAGWRESYRQAALTAMAQRAELTAAVRLLESAGFQPVALKGAWLAHRAYSDPALRPCRDIDLLVPAERVLAAFAALLAAGFVVSESPEMTLDQHLLLDKHLPPLDSPGGVRFELHHRLWEPPGRLDHASPRGEEEGVLARAVRDDDGVAYPAHEDMLAHLIVHAVYSHRLDCGPLLLRDIAGLLGVARIDWPAFWDRATSGGWRGGARLVLDLVARHHPAARIDFTLDPGPPTASAVLADAPALLLQDMDRRKSAGVLASTLAGGVPALWRRLLGQRRGGIGAPVRREMASSGGYFGWAGSRVARTLGDLARAETRRQSRRLARLSRWLDK